MKNLHVEEMGLIELSSKESKAIGGGLWWLAAIVIGGFAWGVANFVKDVVVNGEQFDMAKW